MSRQLNRIRSLIADIEEIQKQGQSAGASHALAAPAPETAKPLLAVVPEPEEPTVEAASKPQPEVPEEEAEVVPMPRPEVGKVSIQLTGNLVVQMQIERSNEIVEVRHLMGDSRDFIEIRFSDGKAVHLPLKAVA